MDVALNIRRFSAMATLIIAAAIGLAGCGKVAKTGRSPAYLIIERLEAASGAEPEEFGTNLLSDVQTLVEQQINGQTVRTPVIFNDLGQVTFRLGLKDPGTPTSPTAPSEINSITINRYRVTFRRADGRNTPGVDVPYGFDGTFTITVGGGGSASAGFEIVRFTSKLEPPLRNLVNQGGSAFISTIAELSFYGQDQAGNEVTVSGSISVTFGDLADPE
jgi:hypothetical protein